MDTRSRWIVSLTVGALLFGTVVASIVATGLRAPRAGEILPCGDPARVVFELGGVKKAICVKGHAWTRLHGTWVRADEPAASPPVERRR